MEKIVVTGGAGFIGSHFLRYMVRKYSAKNFINVDVLTYSGNLNNLKDIEKESNYTFVQEDICNKQAMGEIIDSGSVVVNFAAESHVDNSILDTGIFVKTNVLGTQVLLDVARERKAKLFIQISTDEVYGSLGFNDRAFTETDRMHPSSPYSASKAAAEMLCFAGIKTYKQPIIITRSSNNFGSHQFPEKVIPLFITNLLEDKKVPLYGEGSNIRDWIYVLDHCEAIDFLINYGKVGEVYNIGGNNEISNKKLTETILNIMQKDFSYINRVNDRPGHDLRYALDCSKIKRSGWSARFNFNEMILHTAAWYRENKWWWEPLKNMPGKRTS